MFKIRERLTARWSTAKQHLVTVLLAVGALWVIFLADLALPDSWVDLRKWGIRPRDVSSLPPVVTAPFLHVEFRRLFAVSLPLIVLGWAVMMTDRRRMLQVVLVTALTSGMGAWAFGQDEVAYPGASGVLSGLLGFLVTRGWLARRLVSSLFAIGAGLFYFGELLLLPFSTGVSWASHFWGFAGGVVMAWWVYGRGVIPLVAARAPETAESGKKQRRM